MTRDAALKLLVELADAGFACQVTINPAHEDLVDGRHFPEHCNVTVLERRLSLDELIELHDIGRRYMVDAELSGDLAYFTARPAPAEEDAQG